MFELDQQAKLESVNARAEIHGDERKAAFDLKFSAHAHNEALIAFHSDLRAMLFKEPTNPDLLQQAGEGEALTDLRFPLMGPLKWDWEGIGYHLTIPYGTGGKSDIKLGECKVDKFKFTPMIGGTVDIEFRVIAHPEAKDVGKICDMIQQEIDIILTAPGEEQQQLAA